MNSKKKQNATAPGGAARTKTREQFPQTRVLPADEAAAYIGLGAATLQTLAHRGALPYIRYPLHWHRPSYKMFFDLRDLDRFVDANKEFRYETPDGRKRLNVRDTNEAGAVLMKNQLYATPPRNAQLVIGTTPTTDDALRLVLRSKSMQGFLDAASVISGLGRGGLSPQVCLQAFVIGWYARDGVTLEVLREIETAVSELVPPGTSPNVLPKENYSSSG